MSFTTEQKDSILSEHIRTSCCLKSLFDGILFASGFVKDDDVHLIVPKDLAPYIQTYVNDLFSTPLHSVERISGGKKLEVSLHSTSSKKFLHSLQNNEIHMVHKCPLCFSYFLKGVFLLSGAVSDPFVEFRLEFTLLQDEHRITSFVNLMNEHGIELKKATRQGKTVLYAKKSAYLEDFFALANMNQVAFTLMNAKIEHEIRNNANRVSNCEMSNIEKSVTASTKHLSAIS